MKKKMVRVFSIILFLLSLSTLVAYGSPVLIERRYQGQEESNWCWVANAQNLVRGERPVNRQPTITQAQAVRHVIGTVSNVQGFASDIVEAADFISEGDYSYINTDVLAYGTIKNLIEVLNSPASIGIFKQYEGHVIMIYGYDLENGRDLYIYDPAASNRIINYDDLRNANANKYEGWEYKYTVYCTAHN